MKQKPRKFNIKYQANIRAGINNEVRVWFSKPIDSACQRVESFSISPEPNNSYIDKQGNNILYFDFKNVKNIVLNMNLRVDLWKNKVSLKNNIFPPTNSQKLIKLYTRNERFLEQTAAVKDLASRLESQEQAVVDRLKAIFLYIINNFEYCYPVKNRGVKNLILAKLRGDCAEYSSLFVALARRQGIPARNSTGFVLYPREKKIIEHGWASAYFKKHGWLDVDPQYAALEKEIDKGVRQYFLQRSDYRIIFTNGFNIPLKPIIKPGFRLEHWNRLGLPLTRSSVQTLQPLVFVSRKKVSFKDSIHIQ